MKINLDLRRGLDVLTSFVLIAAAVAVLWTQLANRQRAPRQLPSYSAGDIIKLPELDGSADTLLIAVQSTCRYCTQSMAFYRDLDAKRRNVRLVVVGYEPEAVLRDYIAGHGLKVDRVLSVTTAHLRIAGTPTLILLNKQNKVVNVWGGLLDGNAQRDVMTKVSPVAVAEAVH